MLIKRTVLKEIGLLDERMFMYYEDTDFSWRARLFGYKIYLVKDSIVYHKYIFSKNKNKFYYLETHRLISLIKNQGNKTLMVSLPAIMINELGSFVFFSFNLIPLKKIKSYFFIIKNLNSILKERRKIQLYRKLKDKELNYSSSLFFSELSGPFQKIFNLFFKNYWRLVKNFI